MMVLTKHLQGQHDQDTHGNRGKSYGDQEPIDPSAPRIQEAKTYQELKTLYGHENFPYFITPEGTVIASDRVNSHQGFLITVSKQYPELSEKMLGDLEASDELIETIATQRGYIRTRIYGNTLLIHSKEVSEKALKDLQKMYDQGLFPKSGYSKIDWEGKDFGQNLLRFPEGSIGWTDIQSGKGTTIYVSAKAPDFFYSSRLKYDPVEGQVIVKLAKAQPLSPDFWAEESNQLIAVIKPLLEKIYATALVLAAADLKISLSYTIANASAVAWARNQTDILLSQLMKTTIEGVGPVIADWIQSPTQNMGDLHQSLSRFFDRDRASRVAITETTRAFAEAAQEQYTENGITHWRWNTNNDEYYVGRDRRGVCVVCAPLNGKVVKIGEPFGENRKGEPIIKPPDAHINDRCWVTPVVEII